MNLTISDRISDDSLFKCLGSADHKIIEDTKLCISAAYTVGIGAPADANKKWNAKIQSEIANLTARVFDAWKSVSLEARKQEGDLLEDGEADGYKTEKERDAVLFSVSPTYYDLRKQEARLEAIYNYCNSLSWSLTASAKI